MSDVVKLPRREKLLATIEIYQDHKRVVRFRLVDMPVKVIEEIGRSSNAGEEVSDRLREVAKWMQGGWMDFWSQARDLEDDAWKAANNK